MKICTKCQQSKPESDYYRYKGRTTYYSVCKRCHLDRTAKRLKENPGVAAESRWRGYGIVGMTWELYQQMLSDQESGCAICQKPCGSGKRLAVDHNHETGKVRGLLCLSCNQFIGKIENGTVPIDRLIAYLTTPNTGEHEKTWDQP